ncbi:MAG: M48 family metalloprotease [Alphaproteobacteria bacterium]
MMNYKNFLTLFIIALGGFHLAACSTNPATGRTQFAALMSPQQEQQVGAEEHPNIIREFGEYNNPKIVSYVREVGAKVTRNTERSDVDYKFYVLDSPIVNAFALPGGYIYITRGLLSLAENEAQLAAVLGHEAGHITGRHSAERYSRGVVTSLGSNILAAAIDKTGVSQALGIGSQLYLSSYSRSQENEADTLGLRYLMNSGYDVNAMSAFLQNLQNHSALEAQLEGRRDGGISYFSTHPATGDRVASTTAQVAQAEGGIQNADKYLRMIDGMTYGDSDKHGFVRGQSFIHPAIGFKFTAPQGFQIKNQPAQVVMTSQQGALAIFDMAANPSGQDAMSYLRQSWLKGENVGDAESITVNGMRAATASFQGTINNRAMTIRLVAIEFAPNSFARFQIGIPNNISGEMLNAIKGLTYSFERLSGSEKNAYKPYRLDIVTAGPNDSAASLAARFPYDKYKEERFRVLNGLGPSENIRAGEMYKIVVQ